MRHLGKQRRTRRLLIVAALGVTGLTLLLGPCGRTTDRTEPVQRPGAVPEPSPKENGDSTDAGDDGSDAKGTGEPTPPGPGPRSSIGGVGVGFERSERGAIAAAMSDAPVSSRKLNVADGAKSMCERPPTAYGQYG